MLKILAFIASFTLASCSSSYIAEQERQGYLQKKERIKNSMENSDKLYKDLDKEL